MSPDEVEFKPDVFVLTKARAEALKAGKPAGAEPETPTEPEAKPEVEVKPEVMPEGETRTLRISGTVPPELWNRLGMKLIPKLRQGAELRVGVDFQVTLDASRASSLMAELRQILQDLGLSGQVQVE